MLRHLRLPAPTIRVAALLALACGVAAQDAPFAGNDRLQLTATLGPAYVKELFRDQGVMTLAKPGSKKLTIAGLDGRPFVPGEYVGVFRLHNKKFVSAALQPDKWAIVDIAGRRLLGPWDCVRSPDVLDSGHVIHPFEKGKSVVCAVRDGKLHPVSKVYDTITSRTGGGFWAYKDGRWGALGVDGKVLIPFLYSEIKIWGDYVRVTFAKKPGLAKNHPDNRDNRYGVIAADGRLIMPYVYNSIDEPVDGVCTWMVWSKYTRSKQRESGATDLGTGKHVLKLVDTGGAARTEYSIRNLDGTHFRVGTKLKFKGIKTDPTYRVYHRQRGYLSEERVAVLEAVATQNGMLFLTRKFKSLLAGQPRDLRDGDFKVVDKETIAVIGNTASAELFVARKTEPGNGFCLMDSTGRVVVDNARFTGSVPKSAHGGYFGRVPVRAGKLFGYADLSGKLVIPAKYKAVELFTRHGCAPVATDTGWGVIDRDGKPIVEPRFPGGTHCYPGEPFFLAGTKEAIVLYTNAGVEVGRLPNGYRLSILPGKHLYTTEYQDDKPVRSYIHAMK